MKGINRTKINSWVNRPSLCPDLMSCPKTPNRNKPGALPPFPSSRLMIPEPCAPLFSYRVANLNWGGIAGQLGRDCGLQLAWG